MNGNHYKIIVLYMLPFDKLRANGINKSFPNEVLINYNIVIPVNAGIQ